MYGAYMEYKDASLTPPSVEADIPSIFRSFLPAKSPSASSRRLFIPREHRLAWISLSPAPLKPLCTSFPFSSLSLHRFYTSIFTYLHQELLIHGVLFLDFLLPRVGTY